MEQLQFSPQRSSVDPTSGRIDECVVYSRWPGATASQELEVCSGMQEAAMCSITYFSVVLSSKNHS